MPSTNDPSISGGTTGLDGFFSIIGRIGETVARVAPIWDRRGDVPQPTPPQSTSMVSRDEGSSTTGSNVAAKPDYTPIIIGGIVILAVVMLAK